MPLVTELGNRGPGELIRSQDWNALVAGVDAVEASLNERVTALDERVEALSTRVDEEAAAIRGEVAEQVGALGTRISSLEEQIAALRAAVDPLVRESFRVTMRTAKVAYALGEISEVTAEVTDYLGRKLPPEMPRPWIDFVATWGGLKATEGFVSRGGVGDRTISVQTNADGIARVRLQSEVIEDISDDTEAEVSAALTTRVGQLDKTVADLILEANTPEDDAVKLAYRSITAKYDRTDAASMRSYVDSYYLKRGRQIAGKVQPGAAMLRRQRWRDYRSTVMAFAKSDADPLTADLNRGVSSIQITFRDWITPWIVVDYFERVRELVPEIRGRLEPRVTPRYGETLDGMRNEVSEIVRDRGIVGKLRHYQAVNDALGEIGPKQTFLPDLARSMQAAISIQQSLEQSQATTLGTAGQEIVFRAFTDTAVRAEGRVTDTNSTLDELKQTVAQVQQSVNTKVSALEQTVNTRVTDLQQKVVAVDARADTILRQGTQLRTELSTVSGQISSFAALNPTEISTKLQLVDVMSTQLGIER